MRSRSRGDRGGAYAGAFRHGGVDQGVTDVTRRRRTMSVQLVDQKGQGGAGVGSVAADDSGYFAINSPDNVKQSAATR